MKHIFLFALVCVNIFVNAQIIQPGQSGKIGVTEHLGDTIPLDLKFINEKNDTVTLRQLIDKPVVLSFVYFDCPGICTPLLEGVSDVIEQTDMTLGKDYTAITISFNANDDSKKAVEKKGNLVCRNCKEKNQHWHYLTGDSASIRKILSATGYAAKRQGNDYLHAGVIMVLSPAGMITRYLYGMRFSPFDLKLALIEAAKGQPQPTINKVLEFCYSYDAEGKKYGLELTKLIGTFTLIVLAVFVLVLILKRKKK